MYRSTLQHLTDHETLRHLTDHEHACLVHTADRKSFDDSIAEHLSPAAQDTDFPADDLNPEYELLGDVGDADFDLDFDHADLEVTPEVGDNYIDVDLLFSKGGTMTRGRVTAQKWDADGNPKGRANSNPILDTREYTVTFDNGDVTNLTANLIAESMYAQCDPNGNQYVLLDSLIDHQCLDMALRLLDKTAVRNDGGRQLCCQWKDGFRIDYQGMG